MHTKIYTQNHLAHFQCLGCLSLGNTALGSHVPMISGSLNTMCYSLPLSVLFSLLRMSCLAFSLGCSYLSSRLSLGIVFSDPNWIRCLLCAPTIPSISRVYHNSDHLGYHCFYPSQTRECLLLHCTVPGIEQVLRSLNWIEVKWVAKYIT